MDLKQVGSDDLFLENGLSTKTQSQIAIHLRNEDKLGELIVKLNQELCTIPKKRNVNYQRELHVIYVAFSYAKK